MIVRVREVQRVRRSHVCVDCGKEIPPGDQCVEMSVYETGTVSSEYTCCRNRHQIRVVSPKVAFDVEIAT